MRDVAAFYDSEAETYDDRFADARCAEEERAVLSFIPDEKEVLDIGCGTGLYLRYRRPLYYVGIDPSEGMLNVLRRRHPIYAAGTIRTTLEGFSTPRRFPLIVSLFAAMNYVAPPDREAVKRLLAPSGRALLVYAKRGYYPKLHGDSNLPWYPPPDTEPYATVNNYEIHEVST